MSKYLWQALVDHHENETSLGINLGASWYWKSLRISISVMHYTLHLSIDKAYENV
jgi:hypothetical protein